MDWGDSDATAEISDNMVPEVQFEGVDSNFESNNMVDDDDAEGWEQELDSAIKSSTEIRDWGTLREQIQQDLKQGQKTLPLAHLNQLMILSNFATLRLKGASRIKASLEISQQWADQGNGNWFAH